MDKSPEERARKVLDDAKVLGVDLFVRPNDIVSGNAKINLIFCSHLFNACPGLVPTEEEKFAAAELMDDDVEGSREERSFRMWNNSLGVEGVYLNNLYSDLADGIPLLKVLEKV